MSTQRLNTGEKELEKFIKVLALKSIQVVVQSRLGVKIQTLCNPLATGEHWFNINIEDHPAVSAETKHALALSPGESILQRLPLCVEISLKTVDGDQMVLEVWSLDVQLPKDKDEKDENGVKGENGKCAINGHSNGSSSEQQILKATHTIYNRMSMLLKSLITRTRAITAYKLGRRQCPDSYGIYYRIYVDRPQMHALGEGYKNEKIGQLNTIVGLLTMSVAYRTKMTITPTTAVQTRAGDGNIMLKSDHFDPMDGSPTHQNLCTNGMKKGGGIYGSGDRKFIDIDKPLRPGAFTDVNKLRQYTEDDFLLPETPPFEWLLRRTYGENGSIESLNRKSESPIASSPLNNGNKHNVNNNAYTHHSNASNGSNNNVVAFKSLENDENIQKSSPTHTPPTSTATLSQSPTIKSLLVPVPPTARHSSAPTMRSNLQPPPDDDNLLKELNFPFASPTSHVNDLAKFYRDCYHAPPLRGLNELQAETSCCGASAYIAGNAVECTATIDDLSRQLEQFETSLEDYDKLVAQLGLSASSSTGSRSSGGLQMSN